MATTRLVELTLEDKKKMLAKSPYALPDNPSDKGMNAHQVRTKLYEAYLVLFEWLQRDEIAVNNAITEIDDLMAQIQSGAISIDMVNKAKCDQNGNVIDTTYETITNVEAIRFDLQTKIDNIISGVTTVAKATNADSATKALKDNLDRQIDTTYATITSVDNIISGTTEVGKATKATQDADGNVISSTYQKVAEKGNANGYAPLDANGKVPTSYTYESIKEIVEYPTRADFPATGESGKMYVDKSTTKVYMWSGTTYTALEAGLVIGTIAGTAFDGARGLAVEVLAGTLNTRLTTAETSLALKQNASDNSLTTTAKTIVGAINELVSGKQATLSSSQLDAVNSGATSAKVGAYDTHIADTIIHVSASDKTNWNNKLDAGAILEYSKTSAFKQVAFSGSYNDLTDKFTVKVNGVSVTTGNVANIVLSSIYATASDLQTEVSTRTNQVNLINQKIPSTATSANKLVDEARVADLLSQYSATFRGTFNSLAELQALTGMDINDTAHVKRTDSLGNEYYDLYQYSGTAWVFKYTVNNTTFTSNQWASINSGATATIISNTLAHMADTSIHIGSGQGANIPLIGATDPTTATVGKIGQMYVNSATGKIYICKAISGSTYTWEIANGDVQMDGLSIIKDTSTGKYEVSYGGKYVQVNEVYMSNYVVGDKIDDNIYKISSTGAQEVYKVTTGNRLTGSFKYNGVTHTVDEVITEMTVTGATSGTEYDVVGINLMENFTSGQNLMLLVSGSDDETWLALTSDNIATYFTASGITDLNLSKSTIQTSEIRCEVVPMSKDYFNYDSDENEITPRYETIMTMSSNRAPTTATVYQAILDVDNKFSSLVSTSNKALSASEVDEKIAMVEARHLYKTNAQGSFDTKAELTGASTFYDASGTAVTPTKNDVAYVLADEDHSNQTSKYVVASVSGTPAVVTWAFVVSINLSGVITGVQLNGTLLTPTAGVVNVNGVITGVKLNGNTLTPSAGVVNANGVVLTSGAQEISGVKTFNNAVTVSSGYSSIINKIDNGILGICGGTSSNHSFVRLYGNSYSEKPAWFEIGASNGLAANTCTLAGTKDGSLTWTIGENDAYNVLHDHNGVTLSTAQEITGSKTFTQQIANKRATASFTGVEGTTTEMDLRVHTGSSNVSQLQLYSSGVAKLIAGNGTSSASGTRKDFVIDNLGGMNWNNAVIVHSVDLTSATRESIRTIINDSTNYNYGKYNCLYIFPRVRFTEDESPNGSAGSIYTLLVYAYNSGYMNIKAIQGYGVNPTEARSNYQGSWSTWTGNYSQFITLGASSGTATFTITNGQNYQISSARNCDCLYFVGMNNDQVHVTTVKSSSTLTVSAGTVSSSKATITISNTYTYQAQVSLNRLA